MTIRFLLPLLLGFSPTLAAQSASSPSATSCLDELPASVFTRVPVYIEARATDMASSAILPAADTLALRVAALVRSSIGEATTSLPQGEALLRWRQVGGGIRVAAFPDGHFTWSAPSDAAGDDTTRVPSRLLLAQALAAIRDAGGHIGWPLAGIGDSLVFELQFRHQEIRPPANVQPLVARYAVPVFSMSLPWTTELAVRRAPRVLYPENSRQRSVEGTVILQFVVDSTGHLAPGPIRDKWPAGRPRLRGDAAEYYREFLAAAKRGLEGAAFQAATIGGCSVPQLAEMPFTFGLTRQ